MKLLTEKEISDKARDEFGWSDMLMTAYAKGAQDTQKLLLESASEGFKEWWPSVGQTIGEVAGGLSWQACSLSHAKKMQKKLEKLQTENISYIKQIQDKNLSLVELIEPMSRKLDEKDAKIEKLKREKSTAIKSLDRVNKLLSNGEHLNSSWIKDIIETQSGNIEEEMRLKGVVLKLQKENQEMREALKWALNTLPHVSIDNDSYTKVIDFQNKFNLSETPNGSKEGV